MHFGDVSCSAAEGRSGQAAVARRNVLRRCVRQRICAAVALHAAYIARCGSRRAARCNGAPWIALAALTLARALASARRRPFPVAVAVRIGRCGHGPPQLERKHTRSQAGYCLQRAGGTSDDRRCRPRCCQQHGTNRKWRRSGCSSSRIQHDHRAGTYPPPPRQAVLARRHGLRLRLCLQPRPPLRAPDSHGPFLSRGHWQDHKPSVAAFAVMLVMCMGAVLALRVALVCVALLGALLPSHGSSHPPANAVVL